MPYISYSNAYWDWCHKIEQVTSHVNTAIGQHRPLCDVKSFVLTLKFEIHMYTQIMSFDQTTLLIDVYQQMPVKDGKKKKNVVLCFIARKIYAATEIWIYAKK